MNIAQIAKKTEKAIQHLEVEQSEAIKLAQAGTSAEDWARYANRVAGAEGEASTWLRIQAALEFAEREGIEMADVVVMDTLLELLGQGADDSWSGRTNDVARSKFDGVRKACNEAKYLVISS